ncbi:MAG TPA: sirohydrochlorin chelatase [Streptosporangiaceae bacterium]|nr:sirohydrochlorin chelatase [Streptosporangiaceae bacterium]
MRYSPLSGGAAALPARALRQGLTGAGRPRSAGSRPGRPPTRPGWPPLVAVAHGSADPRAAVAITDLMDAVQARARRAGLPGLPVRAAYLGHALPSVPDVLEALCEERPPGPADARRAVVVLPLLLTAAYHSDTDLPAVLCEAASRHPRLRIGYGDPLGPHPNLLGALERRLAHAGTGAAAGARVSQTAVVLAAAGSSRPAANATVAEVAAAWQSLRGWRAVVPAFASAASPTPAEAVTRLRRAGAPRVVVASYLLAPGYFADRVREASLAAGADAVSAALGAAPEVVDVILERYLQATASLPAATVSAGALRPLGAPGRRTRVIEVPPGSLHGPAQELLRRVPAGTRASGRHGMLSAGRVMPL